jgi:aspartate carbamoyltransferase catalytic subunit
MKWTRKHLLGLRELSAEEIEFVLDTARGFKEIISRSIKKVPTLRGKTVACFFFEPSTRTRTSFELAAKRLSADTINIARSTSSVVKGETLKDTARNIEAMNVSMVIIRHSMAGAAHFLSRVVNASIINAGDGSHEHPTQALLDLYTIREKKGEIKKLKVAIIGDITYSRVARSNIWGLKKLGAEVVISAPPTLIPPGIEKMGVRVHYQVADALRDADVVYVLRLQLERQKKGLFPSLQEYSEFFGITESRLKLAKEDVLLMHPGPINRDVELTGEVADGARSVILEQVTNGIAIRMAVLYLVSGVN